MRKSKVYNVIISKSAEDDLREIVDYYKALNSSYVESVIAQFEHNILSLSHFVFVAFSLKWQSRPGIVRPGD